MMMNVQTVIARYKRRLVLRLISRHIATSHLCRVQIRGIDWCCPYIHQNLAPLEFCRNWL